MNVLFGFGNSLVTTEDNPTLVALNDEHNEIIGEFNKLNQAISSEDVPPKPGKTEKASYDRFRERVESLQDRMLEWENKAKQFIMLPKMTFQSNGPPSPSEQMHVQSHIIEFVTTLRSDIQSNRVLLVSNYNRLTGAAKEARNFWFAIWSFRLAWLGLMLALAGIVIPLLLNLNGPDAQPRNEQLDPAAHATDSTYRVQEDTTR